MDSGHWNTRWDFDPVMLAGFVYRITHIDTGRAYIGKKSFHATTRKKVKGRVNRKKVVKESNWKSYTGSSKWLNEDIAKYGKEQFHFEILSLHESKGSLAYAEVRTIVLSDALRATFSNGTKAYYNSMCPPIKFTVPIETQFESTHK